MLLALVMIPTLVLWVRRFRREGAIVSVLIVSLAMPLAGTLVALALNRTLLWRPLPFREPHKLVKVDALHGNVESRWLSLAELPAVSQTLPSAFTDICGYTVADFIALSEPPLRTQPLLATMVTSRFFDVFGIRPALGALPDRESYTAGERVVMLSHDLWTRRYGGATNVIGRRIGLAGPEYLPGADGMYRIIAVLPRDLWLFWKQADIVLPLRLEPPLTTDPNKQILEHVVARLRDDGEWAAARNMTDSIRAAIASAGARVPVATVRISALKTAHYRDVRPQLLTILVVAIVVLMLAVINVALAAAAQAVSRRHETSVRIALGGSTSRLLREAACEQAVSAALAGVLGGALALWLTPFIAARGPGSWLARLPGEAASIRLDATTWLALVAVLIVVTLIASVIAQTIVRKAGWSFPGSGSVQCLRGSTRLRAVLVATEVALCVCAVGAGATMYLQLRALERIDLGVEADRAFAIWLNVRPSRHATDAARADYFDVILERARAVAGIESVAGVSLPFHFNWQTIRVRPDMLAHAAHVTVLDRSATEDYLDASGIRLVRGRWFDARDRRGGVNTVVVSQSVAGELWPSANPLGQTLRLTSDDDTASSSVLVVGIVSDTRRAPHLPPDRTLYRTVSQAPPPWLYVVAKHRAGSQDVAAALMEAIWSVDPDLAIDGPWPIAKWIDDRTAHIRFVVLLTGLLAVMGIALCGAGLYGLTSYWVNAAANDLGVRRAVGAADAHIAAWFGRQWASVVAPGLLLGMALQLGIVRVLVSRIEGIHEPSWPQAVIGCVAVATCALGGAGIPFRRALRVDAVSLLRS